MIRSGYNYCRSFPQNSAIHMMFIIQKGIPLHYLWYLLGNEHGFWISNFTTSKYINLWKYLLLKWTTMALTVFIKINIFCAQEKYLWDQETDLILVNHLNHCFFLAFYFRILTWMGWCRQKFSKKNQAIWAKNEPQKMSSLTAGGTCSCIIVECTKNTLHNVIQLYKFNWKGVQALVINKPAWID